MVNKISIILPTYNERENVKILIPEIEKLFQQRGDYSLKEIIIIDDFSQDGTAEICTLLNKVYGNIKVIQKKKQGIGAALRVGYDNAKGDILVSMDSDLSFSAEDIPRLLDKIKEGYDLVVGCRHKGQYAGYEQKRVSTKIKGFISKEGNKVISLLLGLPIHDFSANFRAIRKERWYGLSTVERTNILLLEMIVKALKKKYKIAEVPVLFKERRFGKSKLNLTIESMRFIYKLIFYYW